jgi:hypothetical protein
VEAKIRTLDNIFESAVQLQVPLYQRPYVWEKGRQWEPLWADVRAVADQLHDELERGTSAKRAQATITPHFLGAVVLQKVHTAIGEMERYAIIDGQQRLTTLQLLLDAAQAVLEHRGDAARAELLLRELIVNTRKTRTEEDRFKLWPTNVDRAAFREVMSVPPPVKHGELTHAKARVTEAHAYFSGAVTEYLAEAGTPEDAARRSEALTTVLLGLLNVVAIQLEKDENAQVIFETLNARNTPLLASDLVKNVIFQRIEESEPGTSDALYQKHWLALDADEWRKSVRQGRLVRPRLDLLLYYWLIMRTHRTVTSHEVFSRVREMVEDANAAKEVLASISASARGYDAFERAATQSAAGTFRYRVIDVMQADVVTPVLLWLDDPTRPKPIPKAQVELALRSIESFAVRRMLCRLTTKGYNYLFLDLIEELVRADMTRAGEVTRDFLAKQTAEARLWPTDATVRDQLLASEVYRTLSRGRLRMVLEAIEDRLRTEFSEQPVDRGIYTIEHVLPQTWATHWPLSADEAAARAKRDHLLQTLGNLTLVTKKLNPKLSNGAWAAKRLGLGEHSVLRVNHKLLARAGDTWDEDGILARSHELANAVIQVWPAS